MLLASSSSEPNDADGDAALDTPVLRQLEQRKQPRLSEPPQPPSSELVSAQQASSSTDSASASDRDLPDLLKELYEETLRSDG